MKEIFRQHMEILGKDMFLKTLSSVHEYLATEYQKSHQRTQKSLDKIISDICEDWALGGPEVCEGSRDARSECHTLLASIATRFAMIAGNDDPEVNQEFTLDPIEPEIEIQEDDQIYGESEFVTPYDGEDHPNPGHSGNEDYSSYEETY